MKRAVLAVMGMAALAAAGVAEQKSFWPMDVPLPQDALLNPVLPVIADKREDIQNVMVVVQMGHGNENPRWMMSQTQMQVLMDKLLTMPDKPMPEDDIWPKLKAPEPKYKGISLIFQTIENKRFAPVTVYQGRVTDPDKVLLTPDFGRLLEYWLFGTARVRRDQLLGATVLPVISFEQCRLLGQKVVETAPRQCLLPDNNLLLETTEMPSLKAARIRTFDECLKDGVSLIYTFPRRCVAGGGRVFTEPAKVYEAPKLQDAPLAQHAGDVTGTMGGLKAAPSTISVTVAVSATVPVTVTVPVEVTPTGGASDTAVPGMPLSDAQLQAIMPAAGPAKAPRRGPSSVFKYEWADFGN